MVTTTPRARRVAVRGGAREALTTVARAEKAAVTVVDGAGGVRDEREGGGERVGDRGVRDGDAGGGARERRGVWDPRGTHVGVGASDRFRRDVRDFVRHAGWLGLQWRRVRTVGDEITELKKTLPADAEAAAGSAVAKQIDELKGDEEGTRGGQVQG